MSGSRLSLARSAGTWRCRGTKRSKFFAAFSLPSSPLLATLLIMAQELPATISRDHLVTAIRKIDDDATHAFADSTVYDVLFEGRRYPPKAVVGVAAELVTGSAFMPSDFSGGQDSKCFRILQQNGFSIVTKPRATQGSTWILQGNPKKFAIEDYLASYSYIYWSVPRFRNEIRVGDSVFIWRSGDAAGAIAAGQVAEAPKKTAEVNFPDALGDDLWHANEGETSNFKVGLQVSEVRLEEEEGFVPRSSLLADQTLQASTIITAPLGTIFRLTDPQAIRLGELWGMPLDLPNEAVPEALEGALRLRKHYARERSRYLIDKKKEHFSNGNEGMVFCEVCGFDFSKNYPPDLGKGFIEAHHIRPLADISTVQKTTLDDLMLVCANCHRMIHRTKDVEANLSSLLAFFDTSS